MAFLAFIAEWLMKLLAPFMLTIDELLELVNVDSDEDLPAQTQWDVPSA